MTSSLFARSQGVQLFRDGLFTLCQATINGFLTHDQYEKGYLDLLEKAAGLIEKELPSISANRADAAADRAEKAAARASSAQQGTETARDEANTAATRAEKAGETKKAPQ